MCMCVRERGERGDRGGCQAWVCVCACEIRDGERARESDSIAKAGERGRKLHPLCACAWAPATTCVSCG
jgi:hypothetical protein